MCIKFRFGENVYISTKHTGFSIVIKMDNGDYTKIEVVANVIEKEGNCLYFNFSIGRQWYSLRRMRWNSQSRRRESN